MKHLIITCLLFGAVAYAGAGCGVGKDIGGTIIDWTEESGSLTPSDQCGV